MSESEFIPWITHGRHVGAALLLAGLWTIEATAPMFVGRQRRLSHIATNLSLALINALIVSGLVFLLLAVTNSAQAADFGLLHLLSLPVWAQWIVGILLFDCWQYWWHRLNHRVPLLWRFHAVHHADAEMDASSGVRFHTVEMLFSFGARLIVLPLIGLTMTQLLVYEALSLPIILFHHSNMRIPGRVDRCLRWFIVTPWMHYVHHSRYQPETDSNYSSFLSLWDRLFRSFRLRERPSEISLGLDSYHESEWRHLPGLLIAPFRKRRRSTTKSDPPGSD